MKIAVLGTGMVGQAHAAKLIALGHNVTVGTNNVHISTSNEKFDAMGNAPFSAWYKKHSLVNIATFMQAAKAGDIVINALKGEAVLKVLQPLKEHLSGKILIDISNPLDFSKGMPPALIVSNTDSLGEQIQNALPDTKVVKTLNTVSAYLQVNPVKLEGGDHFIFVSGNDMKAKDDVKKYLKSWYGWKNIIDLGDISTSRGAEMFLPLWVRIYAKLKHPYFNIKIVAQETKPPPPE